MGKIQSRRFTFSFFDKFNRPHGELMGSSHSDAHGIIEYDFIPLSSCTQRVCDSTDHAHGILNLVNKLAVPDLRIVLIGYFSYRSYHSHICIVHDL